MNYAFVFAIVVVVLLARLYREQMRLKVSQSEGKSDTQTRVDALEERVRTLERIITDEGFDLKRELHRL